jgi:hypothetical protein
MSKPEVRHFRPTPAVQAAALLCFATHAAFTLDEGTMARIFRALDKCDPRFTPTVRVLIDLAVEKTLKGKPPGPEIILPDDAPPRNPFGGG